MNFVADDENGLLQAAEVLERGGVAVIPTDTVYGLAARPDRPEAVARLYDIKNRDAKKPIALLTADAVSAEKFIGEKGAALGAKHWPGALTVVGNGEAARVPACEWTRRLIGLAGGALRVTSANISGGRPATDAEESLKAAGLTADIVVNGGVSPLGVASTVVEVADDGALKVLRPGPVAFLTLASGSPRRAKILRDHKVDFVVAKSDAEEVCYHDDPVKTVCENALRKAAAFEAPVLSADTIVWFDGRIYGKPADAREAKEFLRTLSARTHSVYTALQYNGEVTVERSDVKFRELDDVLIDEYIARVNPLDRAGAYDIDESGDLIVESYTGSYENIMGLPVEPLKKWGIVK